MRRLRQQWYLGLRWPPNGRAVCKATGRRLKKDRPQFRLTLVCTDSSVEYVLTTQRLPGHLNNRPHSCAFLMYSLGLFIACLSCRIAAFTDW